MSTPSVSHWMCAVPKDGADAADYEDAAAVEGERWPVCAAVADGATESVFAGEWAERLAQGVVDGTATTAAALRDAVPNWQDDWREAVRTQATERPWYVGAKAAEGAFAAVLGVSLHADGRWRAVAVGDCCLFHVRDDELIRSWPFEAPDAFTNRPTLVPSRSDRGVPVPDASTGTWQSEDRFLLATDAVAAWLLRDRIGPFQDGREEALRDRVIAARADGVLRNDDATLLVLDVVGSPEADRGASES